MPGATILDAGAGQGVTQYLLAARGYNVVSLDFSPRTKPGRSVGIFNIQGDGVSDINYQHPYMNIISFGVDSSVGMAARLRSATLRKVILLPQRAIRYAISSLFYIFERFLRSHGAYGVITYVRAPFHEVSLVSESVDAVISISAIEHADINLFHANIKELSRLLKPGAPLLLTTSAASSGESIFHEKSSGWCFSLSALKGYFPGCDVAFDVEGCARSLIESDVFIDRLNPYYYQDEEGFCYARRIGVLPYLPVAVKIVK